MQGGETGSKREKGQPGANGRCLFHQAVAGPQHNPVLLCSYKLNQTFTSPRSLTSALKI